MWSLELPLEKGGPPPLPNACLYLFCVFIHKRAEKPYMGGRGAGGSDKPSSRECVGYSLDFTSRRLIYTHFKTKKTQITWPPSLEGEFLGE